MLSDKLSTNGRDSSLWAHELLTTQLLFIDSHVAALIAGVSGQATARRDPPRALRGAVGACEGDSGGTQRFVSEAADENSWRTSCLKLGTSRCSVVAIAACSVSSSSGHATTTVTECRKMPNFNRVVLQEFSPASLPNRHLCLRSHHHNHTFKGVSYWSVNRAERSNT